MYEVFKYKKKNLDGPYYNSLTEGNKYLSKGMKQSRVWRNNLEVPYCNLLPEGKV